MVHDDAPLRPETVALDALIQATIQRAKVATDADSPDTMLFMGNWHQAIPALVIEDPVLEPIDKLVWMVIMLQARETGSRTAFPSYELLASKTNVASTSTVSRAIAILRIARWLTLCAKVRGKSGQFRGNVYVLHDEPLPLGDALYLDSQYMQFVETALTHHHARVRAVAQGMLDSLDEAIHAGLDVSGTEPVLERRARVARTLSDTPQNPDGPRRYFAFSANALNQLAKSPIPGKIAGNDQNQNSKAAVKEDYGSSRCSSDYKTTTTTTTTQNHDDPKSAFQKQEQEQSESLIYPSRLSDNQKALADRYLALIEPPARQSVLDELQGRLASEEKGMKPVYDELRFLQALCKAAQQGAFIPNLGLKVAEARLTRQQPQQRPDSARRDEPTAEEKARAQALGRQELTKLMQSFGMDRKT
tara:strand:- start:6152 stop:7405 length:1254 start_codon:yes stop_codon:yes gene_type:complete